MKCASRIVLLVLVGSVGPAGTRAAQQIYDIRDYGAAVGGDKLCTAAIQKAIDQCAAGGGGTVYFPPGTWLSGSIELRSHVTLKLEAGCRLLGSAKAADYPEWVPKLRSHSNDYTRQSLIRGEGLEHVAICGRGTIDGQGAKFFWRAYKNRPFLIRLVNCCDVLVEDVSLCNSAMWMEQYLACQRVRIHGITVHNHSTYHNDGVDLDGCRDAVVSDCMMDTDDDGICLKSTCEQPCENVTITNCVVRSHCNAIKMGTESNGGFRNITISNCAVSSPSGTKALHAAAADRGLAGLALEMYDGGKFENVAVSNLSIDGVTMPIFIRLANRARPIEKDMPKPGMGTFRNVVLSNIVATGVSKIACSITGIPGHPVENVQLSNIQITFEGGGTRQEADKQVVEKEDDTGKMFFEVLPAYGFYCRHVTGLKLLDVRLRTAQADLRPAIIAEDVKGLVFDGLDVQPAAGAAAAIRLIRSPGAIVRNSSDIPVEIQESN